MRYQKQEKIEKTFDVFVKKTGLYIYDEDKTTLKNLFGDNFGEKLINICINHQDINVIINKVKLTDKDPIEFWYTTQLRRHWELHLG